MLLRQWFNISDSNVDTVFLDGNKNTLVLYIIRETPNRLTPYRNDWIISKMSALIQGKDKITPMHFFYIKTRLKFWKIITQFVTSNPASYSYT